MRGVGRKLGMSLAAIGAVGVFMSLAAGASAATIAVSSAADPAGTATQCTLRQAIDSANNDATPSGSNCTPGSGTDTITFAPGVIPATITLTAGELTPASNMTIQGPGAASQVTVDANNLTRVFHVIGADPGGGTPGPTVTLSGLTVTGGHYFYPGPSPQGGAGIAVDFNSIVTVDHSAVTNNTAIADINGGGSQAFTIGQVYGGGILNNGTLTVKDSTVSGNQVNANAIGGMTGTIAEAWGAAIASLPARELHVQRSTISGNSATATAPTGNGPTTLTSGAITLFQSDTPSDVSSSTIANNTDNSATSNSMSEFGGGIFADAPLTATSDTVTGNDAASGANLYVDTDDGSMTIQNTIAAGPVTGANCSGVTSAGHNWADDASCNPNGTTDVASTDPNLQALGNYGGPTKTRPPQPPAVSTPTVMDQGVAAAQPTDQRGLVRTVNYAITNGPSGDGTDIGAVEIQNATATSTNPTSPGDSDTVHVKGTSEPGSTALLFEGAGCLTAYVDSGTDSAFASPGLVETGLAENTATTFSTAALYGNTAALCSPTTITYQRRPAAPALISTDPASGGNNNTPKLIGTATASSTVNLYTVAGCTGSVAGTGTATDFAATGIPVTVPDNSTTVFYAQATGVGGTSDCSAGLSYTEVTPSPPPPPSTTPTPTPTPKPKCKKGFKLKKVKGKKKCVRKKK